MSQKTKPMYECVICKKEGTTTQVSKRKSYAVPGGRACKSHKEAQSQKARIQELAKKRLSQNTAKELDKIRRDKFHTEITKIIMPARLMICAMLHKEIITEDEVDMIIEKVFNLNTFEKMYFYEVNQCFGGYNLTDSQLKQALEVVDWEEWRMLIKDFKLQQTKLTA